MREENRVSYGRRVGGGEPTLVGSAALYIFQAASYVGVLESSRKLRQEAYATAGLPWTCQNRHEPELQRFT